MLTPQLAHPHVDRGRGDGKAQPVLGQLEKSSFPRKQFIVYELLSVLRGDSLLGLQPTEQLHREIFVAQNPLPLAHPSAISSRFPQTRDLWKRASMGKRVGRVSSHVVSRWSTSPGCCGFRGVFWVRRDLFHFCPRTHTACCKYEDALPHLPLYYCTVNSIAAVEKTFFTKNT